MPSAVRGLILDFDGLILDTEWPDYLAWREVYAARGHTLPLDDWLAQVGMGADAFDFDPYGRLEALVGGSIDREEIRARRRARFLELIAREEACPGVRELIAEARRSGLLLAVASSSPRAWVRGHLERLGLASSFDCLRCAEDVARTKPAPDLYAAAVACLGLLPEEALALEDSANGLRAAKAAGLRCVVVPNRLTIGQRFPEADAVLPSLADVPLDRLLAAVEGAESHG